jgi:hypothetical protein
VCDRANSATSRDSLSYASKFQIYSLVQVNMPLEMQVDACRGYATESEESRANRNDLIG